MSCLKPRLIWTKDNPVSPTHHYDSCMRRFFIILLIVLLPLRSWSAERMVIHMAASELASHVMAMGAAHEDCSMMMKAASSEKGVHHGDGKSDGACQTCQLCMSVGVTAVLFIKALSAEPLVVAIPRTDSFSSAELARAVKPPIS